MRRLSLLALFLLFNGVLAANVSSCSFVYDESKMSGSRKLKCADGKCEFKILPLAGHAIRMKIINSKRYHDTFIYESFLDEGAYVNIYKGFAHNQLTIFTSAIGNGFEFTFNVDKNSQLQCNGKFTPSFSFTRVTKDNTTYCENILQEIDTETKVIQEAIDVDYRENCPYQLIPSHEFLNVSATLFLTISEGHVLYEEAGTYHEASNGVMIIKNWEYTDLLSTFSHEPYTSKWYYQRDRIAEITAFLMPDADCQCGEEIYEMDQNETFFFKTPRHQGFIMCPSIDCSYTVQVPSVNLSDHEVSRIIVSINSTAVEGADLTIGGVALNPTLNEEHIDMEFLLDGEDVELVYATQPMLPQHGKGNYDIHFKRVTIPVECDCSVFKEKAVYTEREHTVQVVIPETCELMFCEWNIDTTNTKKLVKIEMETASLVDTDQFSIMTGVMGEKLNGTRLNFHRKFYLPENDGEAHISFWRKELAKEAIITISWESVDDTSCDGKHKIALTEQYQTFLSPNYPQPYFVMSDCEMVFNAEENQIIKVLIQEIDLEQVHDFVTFYDGKSTATKRLRHFTGVHTDQVLESTKNYMTFRFHSDKEWSNRGYNFVAFAVNKTITNDSKNQTENAAVNDESEKLPVIIDNTEYSTPYWPFIVISFVLMVFIIALVIVALTWYKKKRARQNHLSFSNELVRFNSDDTEPAVSIET